MTGYPGAEQYPEPYPGWTRCGYGLPRCSPPMWRPAGFPRSGLSARGCVLGSRARSRYACILPHSVTGVSDSRDMTILRLDCAATLGQGSIASRALIVSVDEAAGARTRRYLKPIFGCLRRNRRGVFAAALTRYLKPVYAAEPAGIGDFLRRQILGV